jgi:type IV pilus assembly protein PilY1
MLAMNLMTSYRARLLRCVFALVAFSSANQIQAVVIPPQPLSIQETTKPMIMLGVGRDHRMFYEAYNDASDIDGDGTLDIRFKPSITYLGLFDSKVCYTHNEGSDNSGLFTPASAAGPLNTCVGQWSGNWLNYQTTSRIDALRVVLYGGTRAVDTSTQTILRRAYIPQDAHSWAKEYNSEAIDGYKISDYTPLAQPEPNRRHFFGNTTLNANVNCSTLSNCSDLPPMLITVTNSSKRVWEWASTERAVLQRENPIPEGLAFQSNVRRTVRVEVCTSSFNVGCKLYPNGNYKPVGILHDFGENESALFGMMSGSYDSHLSGGRLRKVMSSFKNEINAATDGTFVSTVDGIVKNMDAFRLYGFNRSGTSQVYEGGVVGNRPLNQGEFPDWGNPLAEMMYEAVRYFANKGSATTDFTGSTTIDDRIGLSKPSWDRPYKGQGTSTAEAPYCARATLLTISDTNISFDSNQLPGVNSNFGTGITTDLNGRHIITNASTSLNVSTVADFISANEPNIVGSKFIGQSGNISTAAPTPKTVSSLSSIRGLAPEEPTKQGSYYASSVAHYAKLNDLNSGLQGNQTVDNFIVGLASPLLRIEAKLPNGRTISLLPFAKSVGGAFSISAAKTDYQPTNQIVDFFVESVINSGPGDITTTNGGRYEAKFRISYEDVEQGNDHDMDAIVVYTVRATSDNTLDVIVEPIYEAGGVSHRMGYVISGTTNDGIYLVVQDDNSNTPYYLNVPPGRLPGYCDQTTPPADCNRLPRTYGSATAVPNTKISTFTFTTSATPPATFLKDPLWYAAKWGGFTDLNNNGIPDLQAEWDVDGDGQPDNYFFVQNPTKLRESLTNAFKSIVERVGSSSNLASNASGRINTNSKVYRAEYLAGKWTGNVIAYPVSISGVGTTPAWSAADQLPVWSSRKLFMNNSTNTMVDITATPYSSLPLIDQTNLQSEDIYNYIKGSKAKELSNGGSFRNRAGPLGDIIHSSPSYDLESDTLYVGTNAGFLHSFNGNTGVENFGYIPQAVVPRLKNLASLGYATAHEYFVDGDTLLSLKLSQTSNKYYLYTLLGRGGKGLFSINPGVSGTTPSSLWEYTPGANVAAAADLDLGFMLSSPANMLLNNGKLGIVVGNGYNSTSGKAVVYIFMINPDGTLFGVKKLDSNVGGDNGMAGPAGLDFDANGTADFIYAGDLKGNLWKFDVRDSDPDKWGIAYPSGVPMFKATDKDGNPQPITAAIAPRFNNATSGANQQGGFLFFGTGSYFKAGDNQDMSVQSWYGIIDDDTGVNDGTPVPTSGLPRSALRQRAMSDVVDAAAPKPDYRYASGKADSPPDDMASKRGWYYDFNNPANGERTISMNIFLSNTSRGNGLQSTTIYPTVDANDICTAGSGDSWLNMIEPFSGVNFKAAIFPGVGPEVNDPTFSGAVGIAGNHTKLHPSSVKLGIGLATQPVNLSTGSTLPTTDPWASINIPYGSTKSEVIISDFNRYRARVDSRRTKEPLKDCNGNLLSCVGGSEGTACVPIAGCDDNKLRGRISWREILKD